MSMQEMSLSDQLYLRFRDLLLNRAGLYYPERKRPDLAHGLGIALSASGLPNLETLYTSAVNDAAVWDDLVISLTIGETYFFRNQPQFDAMRQQILPELIKRRANTKTLRIWSAGCATGEEPYSIAMMLQDVLPDPESWQVTILATDINPQFLAKAKAATYGRWSFRETPDAARRRFFDEQQERWVLKPEIRRMVSFARLNLAEPSYPAVVNGTCAIDIILCRNVTIYFDQETTRQVAERFYASLAPGGWLVVGHAEPQAAIYQQFETHNFPDTVVYRKPLNAPLFAFDQRTGTFTAGPAPILKPTGEAPKLASSPPLTKTTTFQSTVRGVVRNEPAPKPVEPLDKQPAPSAAEQAAMVLRQAEQAANQGQWDEAKALATRALGHDSLLVAGHQLLGQIYEHEGDLDDALASYRRAVFLDRHFVPGMIGLGNVWRQKGQATEAQRYYRNALRVLEKLTPVALVAGMQGATAQDVIALVKQFAQAVE